MSEEKRTDLGDNVYASFDGYSIRLSTDDDADAIFLDRETFEKLKKYAEVVWNTAS